ncbi:K(+)-transporting ATPase subunit F [Paenibacillus terrae]
MIWILAAIVAALMVYLTYVLINPEKF